MSFVVWCLLILLPGRTYCRTTLFELRSSTPTEVAPRSYLSRQHLAGRFGHLAVDNTLIVTQTSCGFLPFAINWILHLQKLDITNFLVIAEDEISFEWINERHVGHAVLVSDLVEEPQHHNSSKAATFGDETFKSVVMKRPNLVLRLLEAGFNVLWIDSDAVLLQKPLTILPTLYEYVGVDDDSENVVERDSRYICTCFMYFKPTVKVQNLLLSWIEEGRHKSTNQGPFNKALQKAEDLDYCIMPRSSFPNGELGRSFSNAEPSSKRVKPYWSHANYNVGVENKMKHLLSQGLWEHPVDMPAACKIPVQ